MPDNTPTPIEVPKEAPSIEEKHPLIDPLVLKIALGFLLLIIVGVVAVLLLKPSVIIESDTDDSGEIDPLVALLNFDIPTISPTPTLSNVDTDRGEDAKELEKIEENIELPTIETVEEDEIVDIPVESPKLPIEESEEIVSLPLEVVLPEGITITEGLLASSGEEKPLEYPQKTIQVVSPLDVVVLMKKGENVPFLSSPVFEGQDKIVLNADTTAVATLYTSTGLYAEQLDATEKRDILLKAIEHEKFSILKAAVIAQLNNTDESKKLEIQEKVAKIAGQIISEVRK